MSSRREGDRTHLVQSILNTIGVEGGTHISFFSTDLMLVKTSWGGGRISPANSVGQRMFQHSTKFTDWARIRILGKRGLWVQLFHSLFSWHSALAHTLSEDGGYHLIRLLQLLLSSSPHTSTSLSLEAEVVLTLCKSEAFNSVGIWLFHF